jgi:hypothetical protein
MERETDEIDSHKHFNFMHKTFFFFLIEHGKLVTGGSFLLLTEWKREYRILWECFSNFCYMGRILLY